MSRVRRIHATVERLVAPDAARGYAGLDTPVLVRCAVAMEDGLAGTGVTGRFHTSQVAALLSEGMDAALRGAAARDIEEVRASATMCFAPRGGAGVLAAALSALDMALWDLKARALGQPLWRLLGGARREVACDATVGLPGYDEAQLAPAGLLMLDANCGMRVPDARRLALMVEDCDFAWFEEPVVGNHLEALAELRRSIRIPLAAGQMMQSAAWFRDALTRGAPDWLQVHPAFCGGVTGALRVLALAEAHGGMLEMHGAQLALRARPAEDMVGLAFHAAA